MNANTETASEYYRLASLAADRGDIQEALRCSDLAQELLLRQPIEIERPGTVIGERINYQLLGNVIAEKRRLAGS